MLELRIVKLSIYYFLKEKLDDANYGSSGFFNNEVVTLMDAYPTEEQIKRVKLPSEAMNDELDIVLPIVAIDVGLQRGIPMELGSPNATVRQCTITVMAADDAESEDISQQIYEWFERNNVPLNNYNEGFPEDDVDATTVGTIEIDNVSVVPVRIVGSPDVADRYRREVSFDATTYLTEGSSESLPI